MSAAGGMLRQRRLGLEARAAFAFAALFCACFASSLVWRQGLGAAWDEVELQGLLQGAREGGALFRGLGQGTLWSRGLAALLWLPGFQAGWLHVPVLLGLLLEAALLWRLVRHYGGTEAQSLCAVALHLGSRLTWLRGTTVLGFSLLPLWALSAWWLALRARGGAQSFAAGLVSGLLTGEHEAGLAAAPGLLYLSWRRRAEGGAAFAAGLLLGWALLLALLPPGHLAHYAQVRGHSLRASAAPWWDELGQNLAAFFTGRGKGLQGAGRGPAFNLIGAGLALWGLRRARLELWLFALGGLALLAVPSPGQLEAHRAAVAWAALCLAAALGLPAGLEARLMLLGLLLGGLAADAKAFSYQRRALELSQYEYSWRLERAARELRGQAVASELNFRSLGAFRLRHRPAPGASEPAWCLLSGEQVGPVPPAAWGAWHPIQLSPESGTLWLLKPVEGSRHAWKEKERSVRQMLDVYQRSSWEEHLLILRAMLGAPGSDPFFISLALDRALWAAKDIGLPRDLAEAFAEQPWLTARQCLALAGALQGHDKERAIRLVQRAIRLDPRRPGARRFLLDLQARP